MVPPTVDFDDFSTLLASSALTFSKSTPPTKNLGKPVKNQGFYMVFAFRGLRARFENRWKIASNALLEQVTPQSALQKRFSRFLERPNGPQGLSGAPRETSWGSPGTLLAANFAPLARSRALLGSFGAALGRSWPALGRPWLGLAPIFCLNSLPKSSEERF